MADTVNAGGPDGAGQAHSLELGGHEWDRAIMLVLRLRHLRNALELLWARYDSGAYHYQIARTGNCIRALPSNGQGGRVMSNVFASELPGFPR